MPLHDNFRDYTVEEISKIKADICVKYKCPYLSSFTTCNDRNGKGTATYKAGNYILFTGKARDCMPDECKHYLDKNVKNKKFGIVNQFSKGDM